MNTLQNFISGPSTLLRKLSKDSKIEDCYRPLLARWVIEVALLSGWHRTTLAKERNIDPDDDFSIITGCTISTNIWRESDDGNKFLKFNGRKIAYSEAALERELIRMCEKLERQPVSDDLGIFANIGRLGDILGLSKADRAVLFFLVMMDYAPTFKGAITDMRLRLHKRKVASIIANITGQQEESVVASLRHDSILVSSGIIDCSDSRGDFGETMELLTGLCNVLVQKKASSEQLIATFLKKAMPPSLELSDYPHLQSDAEVLQQFFKTGISQKEAGCNVLFYGIPGTGKTEFVKAMAVQLGVELYEISFSDEDGDPIRGNARLRAYNLCQRLLAGQSNALLMFDEIEDVFPSSGPFEMLFARNSQGASSQVAKAWVNRTLEQNNVPAIWITNDESIDKAFLRRFDYSVKFLVPPHRVRTEIARRHLGVYSPSEAWLENIAGNEQITPAQCESAAKVARLCAADNPELARRLVEQALDRSAALLGQKGMPKRNTIHTRYDIRFANTSLPVERIINGLSKRPHGTFCFYGPAGTGKSELARHMADRLNLPCIVKRASDILSMWVGGTEKNIAEMFSEARQQEAVLVLDEADSFLADRRDAQRSWEVTQVNELLTQMEAYEGIFVCTTNLMEKLDQASLRRFAFKVKFDYLSSDQRWEMFQQELLRLGGDIALASSCEREVCNLEKLTPGDFAVAARQFAIYGEPATAAALLQQLQEECLVKGGSAGKIGFV